MRTLLMYKTLVEYSASSLKRVTALGARWQCCKFSCLFRQCPPLDQLRELIQGLQVSIGHTNTVCSCAHVCEQRVVSLTVKQVHVCGWQMLWIKTAIRKWIAGAIIINPVFQWKLLFTPFPSLLIEKINTAHTLIWNICYALKRMWILS